MKMKKIVLVLTVLAIIIASTACSSAPRDLAPAAEEPAESYAPAESPSAAEAPLPQPTVYDEAEDSTSELAPLPADGSGNAGESYIPIDENTEKPVDRDSVITFSLKVDTASYSNVERYLYSGELPPADAVRVEEMINYFNYDSDVDFDGHPLGIYTEVAQNPFDPDKYMAFVRVKAREIDKRDLPPSNLVFLIDTSGSMDSYDKLPLLQDAFSLLADSLDGRDRVSIVTYAGSSAVVLDGARGSDKNSILESIYNLEAGGSTAGADGILTAYSIAMDNFIPGGNNRVILATDGDFNVGMSGVGELEEFISGARDSGIYLSTLGFGTGNLRDDVMETLAKNGDGNYSYINSLATANKVLVEELGSNMFTIADDVKAQVEFNPENVSSYRLIGYDNRQLADEDFADDKKDAGEIGVGTDIVALFELELNKENVAAPPKLKYGGNNESAPVPAGDGEFADELFEVRIRYKNPGESKSNLIVNPVTFDRIASKASSDFNFACTVAEFGQQLRMSDYASYTGTDEMIAMAEDNKGNDSSGYRRSFVDLLYEYDWLRYYYE